MERKLPIQQYHDEIVEFHIRDLRRPSHSRWLERCRAAEQLARLTLTAAQRTAAVHVLCGVLSQEIKESGWRRLARALCRPLWIGIPVALLAGFMSVPGISEQPAPSLLNSLAIMLSTLLGVEVLIGVFLIPVSLVCDADKDDSVRCSAARALGQLRDPASVDALARTATSCSYSVQSISLVSLRNVLPAVRDSSGRMLTSQTTIALCRLLSVTNDEFVVHVLEVLSKRGALCALHHVERLSHKGHSATVRSAASCCTEQLLQRLAAQTAPDRLLRPVNALDAAANYLLRPSTTGPSVDTDSLLRPSALPRNS